MKTINLLLFIFAFSPLFSQNEAPQISNLELTLNETLQTLTLNFDVSDNENDLVEIEFFITDNNSLNFDINTENATGDLGFPITPGINKEIVWNYAGLIQGFNFFEAKVLVGDKQLPEISEIINRVDTSSLRDHLTTIEGIRHRTTGNEHLNDVRDFLKSTIVANNFDLDTQEVPYQGYVGENIIGTKDGFANERQTIIVDAHYDTVNDSPGVDDNGTGVAGLIEICGILLDYSFKKSIKIIGFDLEEAGLVGSTEYVTNGIPSFQQTEAVLNFEMIGFYTNEVNSQEFPTGFNVLFPDLYGQVEADSFRGNFINVVGHPESYELIDTFQVASSNYVPELLAYEIPAPSNWLTFTPDLGRSDHAPFWAAGIPALMLTDGANFRNPHYHDPSDDISTIDFDFMANVIKATLATLIELAELFHGTFQTDAFALTTNVLELDCQFKQLINSHSLTVTNNNCTSQDLQLRLFDTTGGLLFTDDFNSEITIDISEFQAGIYLMNLSDGQKFKTEKIVITH